ncbi:hypothetical protein [Terriglobus saanensis]|uniref:Lipoprotein n=1 Tax=Terriglobus saanensis (strain ATCC BAA-1853 / DSM 23119 / SP1PR4) TaxID=401053 RepID=E8V6I5_TERSS|nr:hypothetical protein [Terriglobus saanensis]ADV82724.1 hypothetical protein AciPR4_1920 [Terriglobus saanensis SP1PR4]
MRRVLVVCLMLVAALGSVGCRSKYIEATLENRTGETLHLVTVEYPSASFGTQQLLPGASFHYRFKLLGSGPVKLSWVDAARAEHAQVGPEMLEGQQGQLEVVFKSAGVAQFKTSVRP